MSFFQKPHGMIVAGLGSTAVIRGFVRSGSRNGMTVPPGGGEGD